MYLPRVKLIQLIPLPVPSQPSVRKENNNQGVFLDQASSWIVITDSGNSQDKLDCLSVLCWASFALQPRHCWPAGRHQWTGLLISSSRQSVFLLFTKPLALVIFSPVHHCSVHQFTSTTLQFQCGALVSGSACVLSAQTALSVLT